MPRPATLAAPALGIFAYRGLATWSPATLELPPLEGWIFLASAVPPLLVLGVAVALAWHRRRVLASHRGPPRRAIAALLFAGALVFLACSRATGAGASLVLSAVCLALAMAAGTGGIPRLRVTLGPAAVALLAIPLPLTLAHALVYPLQLATAAFAETLLSVLGVTSVRVADVLHRPHVTFVVVETCSGIGSIVVLPLVAAIWAVYRRAGLLHGVLLVAAAPPLAFLVNGLRVVSLILTPGSAAAALHVVQGLGLFLVGVAALAGVDRLLLLLPPPPRTERNAAASPAKLPLVGACALLALASVAVPTLPPIPGPPWSARLPDVAGHAPRPASIDAGFLGSLRFAWSQSVEYAPLRGPDPPVSVFLASGRPDDSPGQLRSDKIAVPGSGFEVVGLAPAPAPGGVRIEAVSGPQRVLCEVHRVAIGGLLRETATELLGLHRLRPGSERPRVLRLCTRVRAGELREQATGRLDGVRAPVLEGFLPGGIPSSGADLAR